MALGVLNNLSAIYAETLTDTTPALQTPISLTNTPTSGLVDSTTLGSLSILDTDTLSGSIAIGNNTIDIGSTNNSAALLTAAINKGDYGVTASYNAGTGAMTFVSPNSALSVAPAISMQPSSMAQ